MMTRSAVLIADQKLTLSLIFRVITLGVNLR